MLRKTEQRQKKAVILTSVSAATVSLLIDKLEALDYEVPLIACAPGANAFLTEEEISAFGRKVSSYLTELDVASNRIPAVLAVIKTSQLEFAMAGIDPDLVLCFGFPYRLTKKLLSHRAPFVNMHTAPLPSLKGPLPHAWPILRPDVHPLAEFKATWHYMVPEIDQGPIIKEVPLGLKSSMVKSMTANRLQDLAAAAMLDSFEDALKLVESGFAGSDQEVDPHVEHGGARMLTDAERTVTEIMTVEEILRLHRAIGNTSCPPLVWHGESLYAVKSVRSLDQSRSQTAYRATKRDLLHLDYMCLGGMVRIEIRKL